MTTAVSTTVPPMPVCDRSVMPFYRLSVRAASLANDVGADVVAAIQASFRADDDIDAAVVAGETAVGKGITLMQQHSIRTLARQARDDLSAWYDAQRDAAAEAAAQAAEDAARQAAANAARSSDAPSAASATAAPRK